VNLSRVTGRWLGRRTRASTAGGGRPTPASAGRRGRRGKHGIKRDWGSSPCYGTPHEANDDGEARRGRSMTSGGRRRTALATARFFEEGEAPGHRVLVQTAHATKEDEEAPRECFTGDEAPGRPAMARWPASRRWRVCEGGEVRG
jgi:hypothetical protein